MDTLSEHSSQPWDQMPHEPRIWFERFQHWLNQTDGPRSVLLIYKQEKIGELQLDRSRVRPALESLIRAVPAFWRVAVVRFAWLERAKAFDAEQFRREEEHRQRCRQVIQESDAARKQLKHALKRQSQADRTATLLLQADSLLASYERDTRREFAKLRRRHTRLSQKGLKQREKARKSEGMLS